MRWMNLSEISDIVDFWNIHVVQTCNDVGARNSENLIVCIHYFFSPDRGGVYFEDRNGNAAILCLECSRQRYFTFWWENERE